MGKYRRTIITLDDTQTEKDYMLFTVFEKLWSDMENPGASSIHKIHKEVDVAKRFNVGVHVDVFDIPANVVDDPLSHVVLNNPVKIMCGDMRRDPDFGVDGFHLKKGHEDLDSITEVLPQTQSVQEVWGWFDIQRKMFKFLEENNISLARIGAHTQKTLGFDLSDYEFHIGCIYVVHYSPIKTVHIETIPMMPAVRCEIDWRDLSVAEDVIVNVKERVIEKQSMPNVFSVNVKKGERFALIQMNSRPHRIDIDILNDKGKELFFLRNIAFISTISSGNPKATSSERSTVQGGLKAIGLEHYLRPVILKSQAEAQKRKMEFVFFDGDPLKKAENKNEAKAYIEKMIGKAEKKLIIADPYFSTEQFVEYVEALEDSGLDISIINCKEQLEEVAKGISKAKGKTVTFQDVKDDFSNFVKVYNAKDKLGKVAIYIIKGQGRLHDRFLMTDSDGWMIGSSLSEFGNRACGIVKLTDSAFQMLYELLSGWCVDKISDIIK